MKAWLDSVWRRSRYPHAAAAGVLLALAFPNAQIAGLAWVAPALILGLAAATDLRQAFRIGYVAGLAYHLTSLSWLLLIPVHLFPILGWLALSAYLSLFTAVWVWGAWRLWPGGTGSTQGNGQPMEPLPIAWPGWTRRAAWMIGVAALWVGLETLRARLLGGFPWNPLGASQFELVPLLHLSRLTGVYGLSFLVIWFSAGLTCAGLGLLQARPGRRAGLADVALPLLVIATAFAWGLHEIRSASNPIRQLKVAVIQPSIPQTEIWDPAENEARFAEVIRLSQEALTTQPDLLLWPEAAVPTLLRWDEPTYTAITSLARSNQVWMIIGADDAIPGPTPDEEVSYFNSAWLIGPDGEIRATYRKQQLVAFGEEVPFRRWLPFLKWFTPITGAFTRGTGFVPFVMESLEAETSILICFEDVFPHLARKGVGAGTDFLVNLTNDGWFREGSAQRQQAANAVFRAVENGVPLVRCTNNGQTCWVDPFGRIVETFTDDAGHLYGAGWTLFSVSIPDRGPQGATFYNRRGDVFGWMCVAVGAGALLRLWRRRDPAADS
ncbi:MAG: apolipoprotein N-acyltransferase [Verrucomicrobia bacterium]|nr:apolipoprotein N-acyltransferase [Verrucomicrobiota bacterium]